MVVAAASSLAAGAVLAGESAAVEVAAGGAEGLAEGRADGDALAAVRVGDPEVGAAGVVDDAEGLPRRPH